jgi:hypothetical protein
MKNTVVMICTLFIAQLTFAQDFSELQKVEIKTKEECRSYDTKVLECANYILSTPNGDDINRLYASSFILKWMTSTPDYMFELGDWNAKLSNKKDYLLAVFTASMVKFSLENKDKVNDKNEVKYGSYKLFAEYCSKEKNIKNPSKEMKKFIEAYKKDELKTYLKL